MNLCILCNKWKSDTTQKDTLVGVFVLYMKKEQLFNCS